MPELVSLVLPNGKRIDAVFNDGFLNYVDKRGLWWIGFKEHNEVDLEKLVLAIHDDYEEIKSVAKQIKEAPPTIENRPPRKGK